MSGLSFEGVTHHTPKETPMFNRTLALALAAALAAPSAASAATEWGPPLDPTTPASRAAYVAAEETPVASLSGGASGGFDWADAGIGAAVALGASAAGGAVVLSRRRRPTGGPLA
ncbi:MAG TPA: hypothetical protein VH268_07420 [Solirubrobacterales bacterium]|nr:hypothetical protein [Solirubrobacterales bacterium]